MHVNKIPLELCFDLIFNEGKSECRRSSDPFLHSNALFMARMRARQRHDR